MKGPWSLRPALCLLVVLLLGQAVDRAEAFDPWNLREAHDSFPAPTAPPASSPAVQPTIISPSNRLLCTPWPNQPNPLSNPLPRFDASPILPNPSIHPFGATHFRQATPFPTHARPVAGLFQQPHTINSPFGPLPEASTRLGMSPLMPGSSRVCAVAGASMCTLSTLQQANGYGVATR